MILSLPLFVIRGEPDSQNTRFPFPVTVMLLQDPSSVTVFVCPRISAALPWQVKVKVWSLPVTTMVSVLAGVGWLIGGITVGGTAVGNGIGVSEGNGFVSPGVGVIAGGSVSVASQVRVGTEVAVSIANRVSVGVRVIPDTSS
jgi:hypothetical protein